MPSSPKRPDVAIYRTIQDPKGTRVTTCIQAAVYSHELNTHLSRMALLVVYSFWTAHKAWPGLPGTHARLELSTEHNMLLGIPTLESNSLNKEAERLAVLISTRRHAMPSYARHTMAAIPPNNEPRYISKIAGKTKTQCHTCINTKAQDLALTAT